MVETPEIQNGAFHGDPPVKTGNDNQSRAGFITSSLAKITRVFPHACPSAGLPGCEVNLSLVGRCTIPCLENSNSSVFGFLRIGGVIGAAGRAADCKPVHLSFVGMHQDTAAVAAGVVHRVRASDQSRRRCKNAPRRGATTILRAIFLRPDIFATP